MEAVLPRDRSAVWLRNAAIGLTMAGTRWGQPVILFWLPGRAALPAWASVRRGHLLAPAPAGGLLLSRSRPARGESVVAGSDEAVLDYGTGFLCGDVQAGYLPLDVGVDAGGDQACRSPLSRPRARG